MPFELVDKESPEESSRARSLARRPEDNRLKFYESTERAFVRLSRFLCHWSFLQTFLSLSPSHALSLSTLCCVESKADAFVRLQFYITLESFV